MDLVHHSTFKYYASLHLARCLNKKQTYTACPYMQILKNTEQNLRNETLDGV